MPRNGDGDLVGRCNDQFLKDNDNDRGHSRRRMYPRALAESGGGYDEDNADYDNGEEEEEEEEEIGEEEEAAENEYEGEDGTSRTSEAPLQIVDIPFRFCASLEDLASGASKSEIGLPEGVQFFGASEDPNGARSKSHVLDSISITQLRNDFKCSVQINVDGVGGTATNVTLAGSRGHFTAFPGDKFSGVEIPLVKSVTDTSHPFLKDFKGCTPDSLEKGITRLKTVALVPPDHPVAVAADQTYRRTHDDEGLDESTMVDGDWSIDLKLVDECIKSLKKGMRESFDFRDLHNLKVSFKPAFGKNWSDVPEIFNGLSTKSPSIRTEKNALRNFYVTLRVKFLDA